MAANVKVVLLVLALLQLMSLHAVVHGGDNGGVSAVASSKHEPKPKQGGGGSCNISGFLHGKAGKCNREHGSDCCVAGRRYPQFRCSPPVSARTPATLTLNSFARGGDGGGRSFCDDRFHPDTAMVVALSSGWLRLDGTRRCNRMIRVATGNGRSVLARVVDECDSVNGCDAEHNFEPPCPNNVVDGSPAVWKALGLDEGVGEFKAISLLSTSPIIHGATDAAASCHASGYAYLHSNETRCPNGSPDCCVASERYPRFRCSPPVSARTPAILTLKVFDHGEDGGVPTSCDMLFHRNTELVVSLSSGWLRLGGRRRCNQRIRVFAGAASGRSVVAKVVDECDSVNGCREEDGFAPPCRNNVVGGSPAVWKKLGLNASVGEEFEVVCKSKHKSIKKNKVVHRVT
uniref:Uncharacterized protein n=1 Tax=Oryza punctata TaxID=4537 RepID=A0A0E0M936_ORYPU